MAIGVGAFGVDTGTIIISGYLATSTTESEMQFIDSVVFGSGRPDNTFVGGSDAYQEGVWRWVTGPEGLEEEGAGRVFFESGAYVGEKAADWISYSEGDTESNDYLFIYSYFEPQFNPWNGYLGSPGAGGNVGYLVEFGGLPVDVQDSFDVHGLAVTGETLSVPKELAPLLTYSLNQGLPFPEMLGLGSPVRIDDSYTSSTPKLVFGADGNLYTVRQVRDVDGDGWGIIGQLMSPDGVVIGDEHVVNTTFIGAQLEPSVTLLSSGDYLVTWSTTPPGDCYGQLVSSQGQLVGSEFRLNDLYGHAPNVLALSDGNFLATWRGHDSNSFGQIGQVFDPTGNPVTERLVINTNEHGAAFNGNATQLTDGNIVVVWQLSHGDGDEYSVQAQIMSPSGVKIGSEFRVNQYTPGQQQMAEVQATQDGGFVVVWQTDSATDSREIVGRHYDSTGTALTDEFHINTTHDGHQLFSGGGDVHSLGILPDGTLVTVWTTSDGTQTDIVGQRFMPDGKLIDGEFAVSGLTHGLNEEMASLTVSNVNGQMAVAWEAFDQSSNLAQTYVSLSNEGDIFSVDPDTGEVRFNESPDYESGTTS